MRALRFLPIVFIAGVEGFAFFAPYAAFLLAVEHLLHAKRQRTAARQPAKIMEISSGIPDKSILTVAN